MKQINNDYTTPKRKSVERNCYMAELTDSNNRNIKLFAIEGKDSGRIEELELKSSEDFLDMSKMRRRIIYAPGGVNYKFKTTLSKVLDYIQNTESMKIEDVDLMKVIDNGDFDAAIEIDGLISEKEAVKNEDIEALKLEIGVELNNMAIVDSINNIAKDKKEKFYDKRAIIETGNALVSFMQFFILDSLEETRYYEDVMFEVIEEILGEKVERG